MIRNITPTIADVFGNQYKKVRENLALVTLAIIQCNHVNTANIARQMSAINGLNFKANIAKLCRFLQSRQFQVDDKMWRKHIGFLFQLIKNVQPNQKSWTINVDYTTNKDDFLILIASIVVKGESLPLYFSMRRYAKQAGMYDQKKMEKAFFAALRHLLPKTYQYTIVADLGFGHLRIVELLEKHNLFYVLRRNDDLNVIWNGKHTNLRFLPFKTDQICVHAKTWKRDIRVVKCVENRNYWILLTNLPDTSSCQIGKKYSERFSIEKMFKNQKSGGFELEKVKIQKYDRFKRLLFISYMAYSVITLAGLTVQSKDSKVKKKFS